MRCTCHQGAAGSRNGAGRISAVTQALPLSVPEKAAQALRVLITDGEVSPGDKLPEADLAERLGVSRNTLREVFRLLARERLVEHVPNRGVFVSRPGLPEVFDVFRVRQLIEPEAIAGAAPGHPSLERMRDCVLRARAAAEADDWRAVGTADVTFHEAVIALADSPILADLYRSLAAQLRLMFGLIGSPRYMHEQYIDRNEQIVGLIQRGDSADAAQEMRAYLHDAQEQIVNAYVSGRVSSV